MLHEVKQWRMRFIYVEMMKQVANRLTAQNIDNGFLFSEFSVPQIPDPNGEEEKAHTTDQNLRNNTLAHHLPNLGPKVTVTCRSVSVHVATSPSGPKANATSEGMPSEIASG